MRRGNQLPAPLETTSEVLRLLSENWRLVGIGVMMSILTTTTFYLITVYTPTFGRTVLKLSGQDALLVTLLVAVTNFIWNPIGGALSDRIGRKPVLLTIAGLSLRSVTPTWMSMTGFATSPGTDVLPMCSMSTSHGVSAARMSRAAAS